MKIYWFVYNSKTTRHANLKLGHNEGAYKCLMQTEFRSVRSPDQNVTGRKWAESGRFWTDISRQIPILMENFWVHYQPPFFWLCFVYPFLNSIFLFFFLLFFFFFSGYLLLNRDLSTVRYGNTVRLSFGKKYGTELRTVTSGKLRYGTKIRYYFFHTIPYSFCT